MTKEKAYEDATLKSIAENPNSTRQDVIYLAMEIYKDYAVTKLIEECKRVKIQRNEYEQLLMSANRENTKLRTYLKIKN